MRLKLHQTCLGRSLNPQRWEYKILKPQVLSTAVDDGGWLFTGNAVGTSKVDGYRDNKLQWHFVFKVL